MAAKKPTKKTHTWEITLIHERGKLLGYIEAPDDKTAIEEAIKQLAATTADRAGRTERIAIVKQFFTMRM